VLEFAQYSEEKLEAEDGVGGMKLVALVQLIVEVVVSEKQKTMREARQAQACTEV